uniref:t-SNARE coiled-coil homology domain-containing protein n=1 Tax=Triticum urartu TaxID=4572 RepID=A0A8R7PCP5_TRIUA
MPVSSVAKPLSSKPNPFDSDSDSEFTSRPARASSSNSVDPGANGRYKNGFRDSGGFDNQSVQELEGYVAHKAEEVTQKVSVCLRLAENIKEDATNTMIALHKQGQQMNRTHETAANIDQDLSRSETLLGSLGGFFSKTWKPKKTRQIRGPAVISRDDSFKRRANHLEQREKLGLSSSPREKSSSQTYSDPTNAMEKVQVEKDKQDNALSDLSDVLGQLKGMALDMGSEIDRYVLRRLQFTMSYFIGQQGKTKPWTVYKMMWRNSTPG